MYSSRSCLPFLSTTCTCKMIFLLTKVTFLPSAGHLEPLWGQSSPQFLHLTVFLFSCGMGCFKFLTFFFYLNISFVSKSSDLCWIWDACFSESSRALASLIKVSNVMSSLNALRLSGVEAHPCMICDFISLSLLLNSQLSLNFQSMLLKVPIGSFASCVACLNL